ncbi:MULTISPECIES: sulfite exporter TauE/SafE family protein [Cupriavidus]|uniref:Probable membrane transporter protein n=1 Tax=Cupriavidus oxalaticus TaxID=96344 RepID=A0A4P7LDF9_9BURK|nr:MULTISPECIES: sulfite exporter TauE/SafE family protein [Cupriavidus]MBF6986616.1 sulfite exporter TauE/SafE family protein [Cupriavidus sp. IK-TO18]QBY54086.1 sulfite exporter TauE/SafE family protein [Cupriavidus oxalaticus]
MQLATLPVLVPALLALGAFTGFCAGLLGVGGGMMMVPFLTLLFSALGFPTEAIVHMAIATSMGTILFTSLSSVRAHHKRGAVRWPVVLALAPGIVLGGMIGGGKVFAALKTSWLSLAFAVFVGFSALQMLRSRRPAPSRQLPGAAGMLGTGGVIGFLSSLVGAGGAFVSVPFMTWCNVPIHNAVATSAALGFPIAAASVAGYVWSGWQMPGLPPGSIGYIYLPAMLVIVAASMLTAPLGARTAHQMDVGQLRKAFAVLLLCLASYMLWKAWQAF